jgi:hypothetical protein
LYRHGRDCDGCCLWLCYRMRSKCTSRLLS